MPGLIHFSHEMVEAGLDAICENLKYESIIKRLKIDLDDIGYIDDFTYNSEFNGFIKAVPQGLLSHISAGNVFVGAIDTLVQGIITKNINILKMSSFDPVFPLLFAQLLIECDPEAIVYPYFALVPFKGGDNQIESIIKLESDVVIVYGGKEAVEAYRNNRGLFTKDVEFGPKYSCMYIDQKELQNHDIDQIAYNAARDFTMWEQSHVRRPTPFLSKGKKMH
jgi:phenylacetate-CoA ligase